MYLTTGINSINHLEAVLNNLIMEANDAVSTLFKRLINMGDFENKPVIITPTLLRKIQYNLKGCTGDVIFLGFDKLNPLLIPKNFTFSKNVWVVDSHFHSGKGVRIKGDITFLRCEFHIKIDIPYVEGIRRMDNDSYKSYKEDRRVNNAIGNHSLFIQDYLILTDTFKDVIDSVPRHEFSDYISSFPSILYQKNDAGYTIEGNVVLHGPYHFNLPNSIHFKGDLILVDSFMPLFPENITVDGEIKVLSYY